MTEELNYTHTAARKVRYEEVIPQIKSVVSGEPNEIANLANTAAILKEVFDFLWVGFYLVQDNELVLGPFQGPLACTRISKGKGVCGTSWEKGETVLVEDVDKFPGHIACSSLSRSEVVVPLKKDGVVYGVLDVDSSTVQDFTEVDKHYLEQVVKVLQGARD